MTFIFNRQSASALGAVPRLLAFAVAVNMVACAETTAPSSRPSSNAEQDAHAASTGLAVTPAMDTAIVGQTITLVASGVPGGKQLVWTSSDTSVARVVSTGATTAAVSGRAPGTVTIMAAAAGKSGSASVRVIPVPVRSVAVVPGSVTAQMGDSVQLTATPRDSAGTPVRSVPNS